MKARKTLDHQQLILEVSSQLMQFFKPDPRAIKRRIEVGAHAVNRRGAGLCHGWEEAEESGVTGEVSGEVDAGMVGGRRDTVVCRWRK
jgi:hypothetical protein